MVNKGKPFIHIYVYRDTAPAKEPPRSESVESLPKESCSTKAYLAASPGFPLKRAPLLEVQGIHGSETLRQS